MSARSHSRRLVPALLAAGLLVGGACSDEEGEGEGIVEQPEIGGEVEEEGGEGLVEEED